MSQVFVVLDSFGISLILSIVTTLLVRETESTLGGLKLGCIHLLKLRGNGGRGEQGSR